MKYQNLREEELKSRVGEDYFWLYDYSKIIGNLDFCVSMHSSETDLFEIDSLLWAEAKKGVSDVYKSIVQLILTIGKARTFDVFLPPSFLAAFDAEKIAFVPYNEIQEVFYINDFNWNVTPSNYDTKEFKLLLEKVKSNIDEKTLLFHYEKDDRELKSFIKSNFVVGKSGLTKVRIDKNNFIAIYNKWLQSVKPTIAVNWQIAKKTGIIDGDFYLADLLSAENETLKDKLYVLLKQDHYELDRKMDEAGLFVSRRTTFTDKQKAHLQFWNKYERPPKEEYWDYIVARRDLLVPQDIRERKGSFFTPQIWVELSQRYLADVFGENWQDDHYIWDCAAGTGNLLAGLVNKDHVYASTLDQQDVEVMKDRIKNGANLWENHVFQFDFLNDSFEKLPKSLQEIISNSEKRKKLVIYINPPYAEIAGNKIGVNLNKIHDKYAEQLQVANRELFAQFLIRIYNEIEGCKIAEFSKMKTLSGSNFKTFRKHFLAKLEKCFVVPADTFDNVKGQFPIGFKIWNTEKKEAFKKIKADIYDKSGNKISKHSFHAYTQAQYISKWVQSFKTKQGNYIGWLEGVTRNDFQAQQGIVLLNKKEQIVVPRGIEVYDRNIRQVCVCFSVRMCVKATWLNDRDQFLFPNKKWEKDTEFQNDCLAFTLFHGQNRISVELGTNHWIPFTEKEVNAREKFDSHFMTDFIQGKLKQEGNGTLLDTEKQRTTPLEFSQEAKAVFEAGKKLWTYYHDHINEPNNWGQNQGASVNAALYDIKSYFQGRNESGKMNNKSHDEHYNELIEQLRETLKILAQKIEPKVYDYGFLKE